MNNYTVLDVETTFLKREDKSSDNRPYNPVNKLVSVGLKTKDTLCSYYMLSHKDKPKVLVNGDPTQDRFLIQNTLQQTELLIGHNIKFDLSWMRECGYKYEGKLWDTMLVEKILSGGKLMANELGLTSCCLRRGIATKTDEVRDYWNRGIATDEIPWPILKEYGINDVMITEELFLQQLKETKHGEV